MGAGIAQIAALHGHRVQLHDTRLGAGDAAKRGIAEALDKQVGRGRLARADADAALGRIATVVTLPDVCVAQLVVEAIVEDLAAKRELIERVENVVEDTCIVASNTSSLSITALAAGMKRPGRIVGMHFFNPAPLMALVEVVSGLATSTAVAETVFATAQAWGKTPVYATSTPGFIVNRCARPYYAEGLRLLAERAADVATLDAVLREAGGFRMGPFELIDLIGLDVNLAVTKSVWAAYFHDPRYAPSVLQEERVTAGFFGRKSGRGFYDLHAGRCEPAPATENATPAPSRVTVHGDLGVAAALAERIAAGGVAVLRARADSRFPDGAIHVPGNAGGAWLALTDGRTATRRVGDCGVRDLVLFDLAFDYGTAARLAVARADTCASPPMRQPSARCRRRGSKSLASTTSPALPCCVWWRCSRTRPRDAVVQGVASPDAIDVAMQKGVNYPRGPIAWSDPLGAVAAPRRARASGPTLRRGSLSHLAARGPPRGDRGTDRWVSTTRASTPEEAHALAARVAAAMYARDTATQALGIALERVVPGAAQLAMTGARRHGERPRPRHGGLIFTLADSTFAYACNSHNHVTVAQGATIEFLAPGRLGDVLTAEGRERHLERTHRRLRHHGDEPGRADDRALPREVLPPRHPHPHAAPGGLIRRTHERTRSPRAHREGERRRAAALQLERLKWTLRACLRRGAALPAEVRRRRRASRRPQRARGPREVSVHDQAGPARRTIPSACSRCRWRRSSASTPPVGTTGKPTVVGYTQGRHRHLGDGDGALDPRRRRALDRQDPRRVRLRSVHRRPGRALRRARALGATVIPLSGGMTERQVQLIHDFKPDIIMVTPSYMLAIADEMERQGLDPRERSLRDRHLRRRAVDRRRCATAIEAQARTRRDRHLRAVRGDRPRRRAGVHRDQGRAHDLGGPLLSGDRRSGDRATCCPTARRASSCSPRSPRKRCR